MDAWNVILVMLSILSLLATALIGWQIFAVIKIDKIIKSVQQTKEDNLVNICNSQFLLYCALAQYYHSYIRKDDNTISDWQYGFIYESLSAINFAIKLGNLDTAEDLANGLIEDIKTDDIYIDTDKGDLLIEKLSRLKDLKRETYSKLRKEIKLRSR